MDLSYTFISLVVSVIIIMRSNHSSGQGILAMIPLLFAASSRHNTFISSSEEVLLCLLLGLMFIVVRGSDKFVLAGPARELPPSDGAVETFPDDSWHSPTLGIGEIKSVSSCISLSPSLLGVDAFIFLLFDVISAPVTSSVGILLILVLFNLQDFKFLVVLFNKIFLDMTLMNCLSSSFTLSLVLSASLLSLSSSHSDCVACSLHR